MQSESNISIISEGVMDYQSESKIQRTSDERVARLENVLAQRKDETAQNRGRIDEHMSREELKKSLQEMTEEVVNLKEKVVDADAWVFRLAGDRQKLEARIKSLERDLRKTTSDYRTTKIALENVRLKQIASVKPEYSVQKHANASAVMTHVLSGADQQFSISSQEIETLNSVIRHKEDLAAEAEGRAEWFRKVAAILTREYSKSFGARLRSALLPSYWSSKRKIKLLYKTGLFDAERYLDLHPDVAASNIDPLRHYIIHGINEGRKLF